MRGLITRGHRWAVLFWAAAAIGGGWLACGPASLLSAAEVTLRDGRKIEGKILRIKEITANPASDGDEGRPVLFIDDDLRWIFVPFRNVDNIAEGAGEPMERFTLNQQIPGGGAPVAGVGPFIKVDPWDDWGRRIVKMSTSEGPKDIIQGIVLITPKYTQVSAIRNFQWDMRIATSSIDPDKLKKIFINQKIIDPSRPQERAQLVRFYLQARRFQDASDELADLIATFPEEKKTYEGIQRDITQLGARVLLAEVDKWLAAGQYQRSSLALSKFPSQDVAGETLQQVQRRLGEIKNLNDQVTAVKAQLEEHIKQLTDPQLQSRLIPVRDEILSELNFSTIDRMATYQQFADDSNTLTEQKVAFALSGWILGAKAAQNNLSVSLSLYEVRRLVRKYCAESIRLNRDLILKEIEKQEGATLEWVAQMLYHMKPPVETPPEQTGLYKLDAPNAPGEAPIPYLVQLPPEYDPYRKYPVVISLHGARTDATMQLDWWAGAPSKDGFRFGQAGRHGFIVIAPAWGRPHQNAYEFTLREHLCVLNTLRDACRRFSVDTDRVFLSGHSMGGDAAWDIALAHPDLFAGAIPIVARTRKYVDLYWPNARYMPLYYVGGQLDGNHLQVNALSFDRYITGGFPLTVVEFRGRGHEDFSDEILNLFDWMGRYRRDFFPREFNCHTLRRWDNYFWWAEFEGLPKKFMVEPETWPANGKGLRAVQVRGKIGANNNISVNSGADRTIIWLSPDFVSFDQPVRLIVDGVGKTYNVTPDMSSLLEDARARGDRLHPFWARIEVD